MATLILVWHHGDAWFQMTTVTTAILNGSWIMFSHLNALLLILTNKTVRRQMALLLCRSCVKLKLTPLKSSNVINLRRTSIVVT
uniref:Secreted protein n=1 Tax=Caenorhabditis tropicalis TaxID=1561998 RepID=A0A1I7V1A4_9PELO